MPEDVKNVKDVKPEQEQPKTLPEPAKKQARPLTTKINGEDVPYNPAPRSHASASIARLHVRQQEAARKREEQPVPDAAKPEALQNVKFMQLPSGGLAALADLLYPEDRENEEAMDNHVRDLLLLNRDTLRSDTDSRVGQSVRVPA